MNCEEESNVEFTVSSNASSVGARRAPTPNFDKSVNPISTGGRGQTILCVQSQYYLTPPIFKPSYGPAKASSVSDTIHDRDGGRSENLGTSSNVVFIIYPNG